MTGTFQRCGPPRERLWLLDDEVTESKWLRQDDIDDLRPGKPSIDSGCRVRLAAEYRNSKPSWR